MATRNDTGSAGGIHLPALPRVADRHRQVSAYYDRTAFRQRGTRWQNSPALQWDFRATARELLRALEPLPAGRTLEIGCGGGMWTELVGAMASELVAVDISGKMIEEAQKHTQNLPVRFVHGDILTVPLDGTFERVFAVRSVEYIADLDCLADRMATLLTPGGRLVIVTKTRMSVWRGRRRVQHYVNVLLRRVAPPEESEDAPFRSAPPLTRRSPHELVAAFGRRGFKTVMVAPVVLRPPVFAGGFGEYPLIPRPLAKPALAACDALGEIYRHLPSILQRPLMFLAESYCIAFERTA